MPTPAGCNHPCKGIQNPSEWVKPSGGLTAKTTKTTEKKGAKMKNDATECHATGSNEPSRDAHLLGEHELKGIHGGNRIRVSGMTAEELAKYCETMRKLAR